MTSLCLDRGAQLPFMANEHLMRLSNHVQIVLCTEHNKHMFSRFPIMEYCKVSWLVNNTTRWYDFEQKRFLLKGPVGWLLNFFFFSKCDTELIVQSYMNIKIWIPKIRCKQWLYTVLLWRRIQYTVCAMCMCHNENEKCIWLSASSAQKC